MSRDHRNLEQRIQKQKDDLARYVEEQRSAPITQPGKPRSRREKRRARERRADVRVHGSTA